MAFQTVEVIFYVVLWLLAFIAGVTRSVRDRTCQCWWDCLSVGMVGGLYGFATVTILGYYGPPIVSFGWGYIGLAVVIGSLGKEQDRVMRWLAIRTLEKVTGSKYDEDNTKE